MPVLPLDKICCALYEQEDLHQVTGDTLRPGGLELTRRGVAFCNVPAGAWILDVGCGRGATMQSLLQESYRPFGVDASPLLLHESRTSMDLPVMRALGEMLPVASGVMDVVLAECTLSLMADTGQALGEMHRVLAPGGWLIASDLYARNPQGIPALRRIGLQSCFGGMMVQQEIVEALAAARFELQVWEDHSAALRYLTGKIILEAGSLPAFWTKISGQLPAKTCDAFDIHIAVSGAKPGYYLAVARKL